MKPEVPKDEQDQNLDALRHQVHESRSKLVKGFLIVLGSLSVGLGVIGVILPVLPTTPLLLLAAVCYAHSSERFYVWLLTNRYFGHYIRDWREERGLTVATKLWITFILALTMGVSAIFFVPLLAVKAGLAIIGLAVSCYIWSLPTKTTPRQKS